MSYHRYRSARYQKSGNSRYFIHDIAHQSEKEKTDSQNVSRWSLLTKSDERR
ncbi:hypothetical protein EDC54_1216 [Samsonia erythrinae]|uniref:Uncharacterized protein n=1 Tax=Samsonia erythrinae TaxID=160434 RepID=A0A4R3VB60_9GAMM|nr:hypothetical protein EDC54_1216 [Samsonia erythrinae]